MYAPANSAYTYTSPNSALPLYVICGTVDNFCFETHRTFIYTEGLRNSFPFGR
jgi:hypothetical protein